jgi:glutaredoxin
MSSDLAFLAGHDLAVYSSRTCADCDRLERWLQAHGVAYRKLYIDDDPAAADKLERETGLQSVPHVLVDGQTWVRGYIRDERADPSGMRLVTDLRAALRRG